MSNQSPPGSPLRPFVDGVIVVSDEDQAIPLDEIIDRLRLTADQLNDEIRSGRLEVISEPTTAFPPPSPARDNGTPPRYYVLASAFARWLVDDTVDRAIRERALGDFSGLH